MRTIAYLICTATLAVAQMAIGAEPVRPVKVLAVLRTQEASQHMRLATGNRLGVPLFAADAPMNAAYMTSVLEFDRDTPLAAALTLAFRDRAPFVELSTSADRDRYMSGAPFDKPTLNARNE